MRTNFAGFALSLGMGLIVLLIGFVALSAAGLVSLGPPVEGIVAQVDSVAGAPRQFGEYGPGPRPMSALSATDTASVVSTSASAPKPGEMAAIVAGDALFKNNCTQCHAVNEKVVGPALAGIDKRRSVSWVVAWVRNSAKVVASGDDYAVKLFNDNGKQQMPAFPNLSDKDIKAIITWVNSQEGRGAVSVSATLAAR